MDENKTNDNLKSIVFYCYKEDESTKKNLQFFLDNGTFDSNNIKFVIIVNDNIITLKIPEYCCIILKDNSYDMEAYKYAIEKTENLESFDTFYFLNSSCIGPFVPEYCKKNWIEIFNDMFIRDICLVGPIIEIPGRFAPIIEIPDRFVPPFIHTYMFGVNKIGLEILLTNDDVFVKDVNKEHLLVCERLITSKILDKGKNVKSLLRKFRHINWLQKEIWNREIWQKSDLPSCPEIPFNYDGIDIHPFEIIFVKNIRDTHSNRIKSHSGISTSLSNILNNYIKWS